MNTKSYIENSKSKALYDFKVKLRAINDEALKHGAQGGSRMLVEYQKALSQQIGEFGNQVIDYMTKNDPLHSPIKIRDFDIAEKAVGDIMRSLFEEYRRRESAGKVWGDSTLEINQEFIDLEKNKVIHEIELAKATFKSKRSILKWAFGDARKRMFSMLSAAILLGLGAILNGYLSKLKDFLLS